MKKLFQFIRGFLVGTLATAGIFGLGALAMAQLSAPGDDVPLSAPGLFAINGSTVSFSDPNYLFGDASHPIANGYFTTATIGTLTISGVAPSGITAPWFVATSTSIKSTFAGGVSTTLLSVSSTIGSTTGMNVTGTANFTGNGSASIQLCGGTNGACSALATAFFGVNVATGGVQIGGNGSNTAIFFEAFGSNRAELDNTGFYPLADAIYTNGAAGLRWSNLFAVTSTLSYLAVSTTAGSINTVAMNVTGTINATSSGALIPILHTTGTVFMAGIGAPSVTEDIVCYRTADANITHQATNCTVSSAYFKDHINSMSPAEAMSEIRKLRPVTYRMKSTGNTEEGFIAEEVARIDPTLVVWTDGSSYSDAEWLPRLAFVKANYPDVIRTKYNKVLIPQTVDYARFSVLEASAIQNLDERLTKIERK